MSKKKYGLKKLKLMVVSQGDLDKEFMKGVVYVCGTFTKSHGKHRGIEEILRACGIKTDLQACATGAAHCDLDGIRDYLK